MKKIIPISEQQAKARLAELQEAKISHAWIGHGSAIFLEMGELTPPKRENNPSGEQTIMIEWSWRLEDKRSIVLGSWSDQTEIDQLPALLVGRKIKTIKLFGRIPELEISLCKDLWLLTFMTDKKYPEWSIRFRNGQWLDYDNGSFNIEITKT
ncbi:hypothetical protein ACJJIL_21555 [Microbulbifer sp. EKSA005]|uniref:hypothetical protein n=1 Tax=Microbulbifer sp. EKSA005 TaxID=3243364 RepID=UPI004043829B